MKSRHEPPPLDSSTARAFFTERIPAEWFIDEVEVSLDDVEILIVGRLAPPDGDDAETACRGTIEAHREATRDARIRIAADAEREFERKVSWGARCGDLGILFTHLSVPAMTRLRLPQRLVLDTLVDGGVARSRSEALAWCVRLVERNLDEWLAEMRDALANVEDVRRKGPDRP